MTTLANHEEPDARVEVDTAELAGMFQALGSPIRLRLLMLVGQASAGEACFCDLADEFDMPPSSLSHHLKILVNAGLLSRERRGTWSWYRTRTESLDLMSALLRPGSPLRERSDVAHRSDRDQ